MFKLRIAPTAFKTPQAVESQEYDTAQRIKSRIDALKIEMAKTAIPGATLATTPANIASLPDLNTPTQPHATGTTNASTSFPTTSIPAPNGGAHPTNAATSFPTTSIPAPTTAGIYTASDLTQHQSATAPPITSAESSQCFIGIEILMQKLEQQVKQFRDWCTAKKFRTLHDAHFDWCVHTASQFFMSQICNQVDQQHLPDPKCTTES